MKFCEEDTFCPEAGVNCIGVSTIFLSVLQRSRGAGGKVDRGDAGVVAMETGALSQSSSPLATAAPTGS